MRNTLFLPPLLRNRRPNLGPCRPYPAFHTSEKGVGRSLMFSPPSQKDACKKKVLQKTLRVKSVASKVLIRLALCNIYFSARS